MRKIEAIVRPSQLSDIQEELSRFGVGGMTVSEVMGCGLQKGVLGIYRGKCYEITLLPKVKIEIVAPKEKVPAIVEHLIKPAWTGEVGDGKIFVFPIEEVIRIRTGETGISAL